MRDFVKCSQFCTPTQTDGLCPACPNALQTECNCLNIPHNHCTLALFHTRCLSDVSDFVSSSSTSPHSYICRRSHVPILEHRPRIPVSAFFDKSLDLLLLQVHRSSHHPSLNSLSHSHVSVNIIIW